MRAAWRQGYFGNADPETASRFSFLQGLKGYRERAAACNPAVFTLFKQVGRRPVQRKPAAH